MGEHALSVRRTPALHLFRHERLRPFRARAVLVDRLLAGIAVPAGRHLHRACAPRRRRRLARALECASRARSRLAPAAVLFLADRRRQRRWYYYNAHVLNEFRTAKHAAKCRPTTSATYKKYERLPQPKIIAVDTTIDIIPERRSFSGTGHYILQNKTAQPIAQIHITDQSRSITNVKFDRPFHVVSSEPARASTRSTIWNQPLAPGESCDLNFSRLPAPRLHATATNAPSSPTTARSSTAAIFPPSATTPASSWTIRAAAAKRILPRSRICRPAATRGLASPISSPPTPTGSLITPSSAPPTIRSPSLPDICSANGTQNGRHYYEYNMGARADCRLLLLRLRPL